MKKMLINRRAGEFDVLLKSRILECYYHYKRESEECDEELFFKNYVDNNSDLTFDTFKEWIMPSAIRNTTKAV